VPASTIPAQLAILLKVVYVQRERWPPAGGCLVACYPLAHAQNFFFNFFLIERSQKILEKKVFTK